MKKKLFPLLFLCFVFIFSAYFVKPVFSQQAESKIFTGIINDDSVNIRSGAGVNFEILRKMDKNDLVLVQDTILDWYKIKLPRNSKAYISKEFLRMDGNSFGYSNADRVNVRAGKGTNFNVIGQLSKDDLVEVIEVDNEWVQIFSDSNCFAWVHKDFLNFNGPDTIYIAQENKNQEAWKLLQQAKIFEQSEGGITETNDKRAASIQKYNAIIRDYPQTSAANSAKKYISMLSMKNPAAKPVQPAVVPEPQKTLTPESVKTPTQSEQQTPKKRVLIKPTTNPIAQGKLVESGRFFFRPGTHKLIENNQEKYYLKSKDIDLNTYIYHTVQIWGKIVSSDKTKIPIIEVEYVNQLN